MMAVATDPTRHCDSERHFYDTAPPRSAPSHLKASSRPEYEYPATRGPPASRMAAAAGCVEPQPRTRGLLFCVSVNLRHWQGHSASDGAPYNSGRVCMLMSRAAARPPTPSRASGLSIPGPRLRPPLTEHGARQHWQHGHELRPGFKLAQVP